MINRPYIKGYRYLHIMVYKTDEREIGYEPAGRAPPPRMIEGGFIFRMGVYCLVPPKFFPKKSGFCRRY